MFPNNSAGTVNVPICIEPIDEYKIAEISYDGQEKYIPPLSMSENLSQLIQKIDFNQPIDELKKELETPSTSQDAKPKVTTQPGLSWPFESMRVKLRAALTEICVLNDVLSIAKEKKYMIFDAVNPRPSDQRPIVGLMAKKKAFQTASQILLDGSAKLAPSETPNFFNELREMRQRWHIKRFGTNILGDLSYFRPVGYRFLANTRFEVFKSTQTKDATNQALTVKVPRDLEGHAQIITSIIRDKDPLIDIGAYRFYEASGDDTWQDKLESAQNVLFCKELFRHLASQAVQYQFVVPATVTGNQIILALFPDVKLYITLVHKTPNTKCLKEITEGIKKLQKEHKPVLEHSLHQMLKDFYASLFRRMQGKETPKEAGPSAMDKKALFELARQEMTLEKIVKQAQHLIIRHQTMNVIDTFASKIKDPLIISHWLCLNSPTTSIVRVDIVSLNNEILGRSHMLIYVGTKQLRVITRDCKNLVLGYEPEELRHLLVWQSCLHQFIASEKLSKLLGWYTLNLNYNVNATRQDISSTVFSLVICSPNCSQMIFIKSGPQFGLTVDVAQFKNQPTNGGGGGGSHCAVDLEELSKLQDKVENSREVDWDKMPGGDFLTKLELLMSVSSN